MITVKNFLSDFRCCKTEEEQTKLFQKHLNAELYVPYLKKIVVCKNIVNKAYYKLITLPDGTEKKCFSPNSALTFCLYMIELIRNYTDIIFVALDEKLTDEEILQREIDAFDLFEKHGVTELFIKCLDKEAIRFQKVLDVTINDAFAYEANLPSYFDTKLDTLNLVSKELENALKTQAEKA